MTTLTVSIGLKFELHSRSGCKHGGALLVMPLTGLINKLQTAVNIMAIGLNSLAFGFGLGGARWI